jgi:diadenosine tetraphosphate (Ap4A) HIT family hydrolase
MFTLHPQLEADCALVGDLSICRVLLNAQFADYTWLILVPRRTGCRDLTDVSPADFQPLMEEVAQLHDALKAYTKADKMNVAAIGNMVPQLHIHVIARHVGDAYWPKPLWGHATPRPDADGGKARAHALRQSLVGTLAGLDWQPLSH